MDQLWMHQQLCGHYGDVDKRPFRSIVAQAESERDRCGKVVFSCPVCRHGSYSVWGLEMHVESLEHHQGVEAAARETRSAWRAVGMPVLMEAEDQDDEEGSVSLNTMA